MYTLYIVVLLRRTADQEHTFWTSSNSKLRVSTSVKPSCMFSLEQGTLPREGKGGPATMTAVGV